MAGFFEFEVELDSSEILGCFIGAIVEVLDASANLVSLENIFVTVDLGNFHNCDT